MKKFFIALCDILAVSVIVALVALVIWGLSILLGWAVADTAEFVFTVAAVIVVVATCLSYIVWDNGGELDDAEEDDE